jgi:O-antigen/teichoic acid export membrane protein
MKLTKNTQNIFYLFSVEFIVRLFGFFAVAYLARTLGKSGFGIINIGLGILSYAMILSIGGLNLLGVRKVAAKKEAINKLALRIISARLFLSAIMFIVFTVILYFLFDGINFSVSIIYLVYMFPAVLLVEWYFQGRQRMGSIAAGKAFGMAAYLLMIVILVQSAEDIIFTPIAWTIGAAVNGAFLLMMIESNDRPKLKELKNLKIIELLKESFPLAGASIIAQVVIMFPVIFIGLSIGDADAGVYSAAYKIIILILVLDRVFNALFFPKIVNHINYMPEKVGDIFRSVLKIICFVSTSFGLIALLLGEPLMLFVFGEEYISAVPIFQVLIGFFILTLVNSVFTYTLIGKHKERVYTTALSIGAILFFVFGISLTIYFGTIGMAIGVVIFEISALTYMIFNLSDIKYNLFRTVVWPVIFTLITAFCLVELLHLSLILELLIALTAIILSGATIRIGKDELNFIKQVLF